MREEFEKEAKRRHKPRLLITIAVGVGLKVIEESYNITEISKYTYFLAHLGTTCLGGAFVVVQCPSSVMRRQHLPCGHSRDTKEIPCGCSKKHIYCPIDEKISQNHCLVKISNYLEFGSSGVIN